MMFALWVEYLIHGRLVNLVAVYFGIFLAFTKGYLKLLEAGPLVFIGTISYSLYLIHQNIGYIVIRGLEKFGLATSISTILIPLTVSVIIAGLLHKYIERPALIKIRNTWQESSFRKYLTHESTMD